MGVSIIRGAIGSGKSGMCLDAIERVHMEYPDAKCIMIIPDHYSYETEKKMVERFGGTGLNNIEVLTLRRMALSALTVSELNHLTDAGKQMLIHKAVTSACQELENKEGMDIRLITAMRRAGFLDVIASLISELKRYMVTPQMLSEKAETVTDNETLKNKLTALSNIYGRYCSYVDDAQCTDSEDDLFRLAAHIENDSSYNDSTYVWINRFDKFMPQQLRVIESLLKRGAHMTVSICCPIAEDDSERELYLETENTLRQVMKLADVYGFEGEYRAGKGLSHLRNKPDLYTLFRYWGEHFEYTGIPDNISMFEARDTYSETERIAGVITDLTRDGECRFRDIAVMCGNEEEYIHLIEAIFDEYGIPYFTDRKIILSDHPIAMQIMSLFSVLDEDWSYDSVFRYLRAGFIYRKIKKESYTYTAPIGQEEIDSLENFVLRCGIRGSKRWLSDEMWLLENDIVGAAFGEDGSRNADESLELLRREIAYPLSEFHKKTKGKKNARGFAEALFEFLEDINLYAGLKNEIRLFKKRGMVNEAEQFTKIWNLILDVLNQTTAALGDDKMTLEEFSKYISVGLSKCEIRIIPSGIDQVYVGSAERISHTNVKVMFIAGAKNGTFPSGIKTEGFLSDRDRNTMRDNLDITIAPDTKRKNDEQYFKIYRALCSVTDKLCLSYAVQDEEGRAQTASHMLLDIHRKFPNLTVTDNLADDPLKDIVYISSPKATLHKLLINLSKRHKGKKNLLWDIVYDWYDGREEWKHVISLMDRADYYSRRGVILDGDIANLLYSGKITYSASRINTFARCPFEYFLKYGLGARKREEWDVTPANMGTYAHRVINDFCIAVENGAQSNREKITAWRELTDERRTDILNEIIEKTCENMLSSPVRDKERTVSIFRRMGKTIASSAVLVQKSLSAGNFAENGMELQFETDITDDVALKGLIDRIDTCETDEGNSYMRIIDYKTGKTEFNVVNIANGYDMQMVIYALAARELMRESRTDADVTGIYYTGVRSGYRELNSKVNEDNIKDTNIREMCLDGVTFADEKEEERGRMLYNMDNGFFENQSSIFTKVKFDKKGEIRGLLSLDEINGLMKHVKDTITDMDSRTRSGIISLNPYNNNGRGGVCEYCDYESVCKFDEKSRVMREPEGKKDQIWENMKLKGAAMRGGNTDAIMD